MVRYEINPDGLLPDQEGDLVFYADVAKEVEARGRFKAAIERALIDYELGRPADLVASTMVKGLQTALKGV